MNIAILPKLADEDALAPKMRDRDAGAKAEAFEGEMKGAEGRARTKADGARDGQKTDKADTAEAEDARPADGVEPEAAEAKAPRDVLSLLAAVSQAEARGANLKQGASGEGEVASSWKAAGAPDGLSREWIGVDARPVDSEVLDEAGPIAGRASGADKPEGAKVSGDVPRSRLVVARQETHFEPVLGQAVLVEVDGADASQKPASKDAGIVRLLDTRAGEPSPTLSRDMRPERVSGDPSTVQATNVKQDVSQGASGAFQVAQSGPSSFAPRNDTDLPAERPDVAQMVAPSVAERADTRSARARSEPVRSVERRIASSDVDGSVGRADESASLDADSASPLMPANRKDQSVAVIENRASKREAVAEERPAPSFAAANEQRTQGLASREGERLITPAGVAAPSGSGSSSAVPAMSVQVAERIIDAFGGPSSNRPVDEAPSGSHLRLRAGGGALKTLVIQLQPENLGLLHVSMRLHEGQLMLEIAADKVETARMLSEDRASLRSLLEKAGFSLEDSSIVVAVRETGPSSPATAAREGAPNPDGRGAERQSGQGAGEGERGRPEGEGRDQPARRRAEEPVGMRPTPAGTTFL